jgi:hypothetical protein
VIPPQQGCKVQEPHDGARSGPALRLWRPGARSGLEASFDLVIFLKESYLHLQLLTKSAFMKLGIRILELTKLFFCPMAILDGGIVHVVCMWHFSIATRVPHGQSHRSKQL